MPGGPLGKVRRPRAHAIGRVARPPTRGPVIALRRSQLHVRIPAETARTEMKGSGTTPAAGLPSFTLVEGITMKRITALLLLFSAAACAGPLGTEPISPSDAALAATTQAKPITVVGVETIDGNCASGITVRVTGQNLSGKSRYLNLVLRRFDGSVLPVAQTAISAGSKKSIVWTTYWSSEAISPAVGSKFNGTAVAWVGDASNVALHDSGVRFIGPTAC